MGDEIPGCGGGMGEEEMMGASGGLGRLDGTRVFRTFEFFDGIEYYVDTVLSLWYVQTTVQSG